MKKAYTITIESGSTVGKAVIMAKSYKDAMTQATEACPAGFKVASIQENGKEQKVFGNFRKPKGPRCALGAVAERGRLYKPSKKPAFWTGKKRSDFKKC